MFEYEIATDHQPMPEPGSARGFSLSEESFLFPLSAEMDIKWIVFLFSI